MFSLIVRYSLSRMPQYLYDRNTVPTDNFRTGSGLIDVVKNTGLCTRVEAKIVLQSGMSQISYRCSWPPSRKSIQRCLISCHCRPTKSENTLHSSIFRNQISSLLCQTSQLSVAGAFNGLPERDVQQRITQVVIEHGQKLPVPIVAPSGQYSHGVCRYDPATLLTELQQYNR